MISNAIVMLSILLASGYFIAWLIRRDVRERIERPKQQFQDQVQQYDQQCHNESVRE
jgi:hypothetical protein